MLDLVEHITHQHTRARLLLIVLSRPELLDRRPTWGGRQNFTSIALQPLTPGQTGELVQRLSVDLSPELRQQIAERSGGNPFFALELARGVADRGVSNTGADTLPDTVHAAVQARIDVLSRHERTVLQVAAVASRSIRPTMLHAVLDEYSVKEIETALDGLLSRDMLVSAEGDGYTFRHILIRDVAYGTLSRAERVRLHSKIAMWLETSALAIGQADAYAGLIAYHYREAVMLSRQSAIPRPMPRETERAVHFLERAGLLAAHAGAFGEARDHLRNTIALAPQSEHLRLYEVMGDSLVWGDDVVDAYHSAVECWRAGAGQHPLTGARLMRKLLSAYRRASKRLEREERDALWSEAQRLVQQAGDEAETWRYRVTAYGQLLQDSLLRGNISDEQRREGLITCEAAAAFFEHHEDWCLLDVTLDIWVGFCMTMGAHVDAMAVSSRRLAVPGISMYERGDAVGSIASIHFLRGEYEQCIATAVAALSALHPGEPIEYLAPAVSIAMWASYVSGRWNEIGPFLNALKDIWERLQLRPGAGIVIFDGYLASLLVAKAREDRPSIDLVTSVIERMFGGDASIKGFLTAIRDGDMSKLNVDEVDAGVTGLLISLYSELGLRSPEKLMQGPVFQNDMTVWCAKIAQALRDDDNAALASAIDEAEAHGLIVHAARMRVVLAQRTDDRTQLDCARLVLEPLGDRVFLRRIEEAAGLFR